MKRYIAPIVIIVLMIIPMLIYLGIILWVPGIPLIFKLLGALIPIINCALLIWVFMSRIRELKGGEEDAASKY